MKLGYLAFRNMISKPLNLLLSLMLLVLSVSLVTFVLQLSQQLGGQLKRNIAPFDMVVGAKGSPLQLVLSSVLHIDVPTGNIKYDAAKALEEHPFIEIAIPVSYGDNYRGFRILGTKIEYLDQYKALLSEGVMYDEPFEVVAGSSVAGELGLTVGEAFVSSHGLTSSTIEEHHEHPFVVRGILERTGTVVDQLLITSLESIWEAHDHGKESEHQENDHDEEHHHDEEHSHGDDHHHEDEDHHRDADDHSENYDEEREITSMLIRFANPMAMVQLPRFINENTNMQAALPGFEVQRLMGLLGSGVQTINGIALAILLVSGLSIFISLLKTIRERKQELALLRTYGLRTGQLLGLALMEGLFLALIGFIVGWLFGRFGIWSVSQYMEAQYGYALALKAPEGFEMLLLCLTLALAAIATLLASTSIFKLNVAKTLSDV